jgi:hypothetical protein
MAKGRKTGGRKTGTPNKATATAREAIALVADGKAQDFMRWLDMTASGIKQKKGWLLRPNPEGAAGIYLKALEYHVPKLQRTELTGKDGEALPAPATIIIQS